MTHQRPVFLLIILLFLGWCMSGCQPQVSSPNPVEPVSNVDTSHPRAKLVIGSKKILGKVKILNPRFRKVGKMTQAEVTVQNLSDTKFSLEYKFDWQDAQGFTVDSGSMWHRFTLTPHQMRDFSSTGKTPAAEQITFTVRFPHDAFID
ncbi:MAG: DUF1425 domain-containing protein [Desulfovermiculus sp.]|nr:DUF1425 domain-containing protein [Desulfovermiculus sp.]